MPVTEFIGACRDIFKRELPLFVRHSEIRMRYVGDPSGHPTMNVAFYGDRPFRFFYTRKRHFPAVFRLLLVNRLVDAAEDMDVVINFIRIEHRQPSTNWHNLDMRRELAAFLIHFQFSGFVKIFAF